jgi:UDP-perosamine 4-acetyltransferase
MARHGIEGGVSGPPVVVLGTGGHASVVIGLARRAGREVKGCAGPDTPVFPASFCPHLGSDSALEGLDRNDVELAMGVGSTGDAALRRRLFETWKARGFRFAVLVDPTAFVAGHVDMAEGVQVMARAAIQVFAALGANAIVNTGAIVEHHCRIGAHVHVAPGAVVCGAAVIEDGAHVGANATVLQGVRVAEGSVIGAGAVAVRDVPAHATVKGIPAS